MGGLSIWHWLIVLAVVLLLFGGSGKVSTLMGDFAKGMKSFKKNMADDESMEAQGTSGGNQGTTAHPAPTTLASPTVTTPGAAPVQPAVQEPVRHG
jgi:sec-independent protein translocase protein TatA